MVEDELVQDQVVGELLGVTCSVKNGDFCSARTGSVYGDCAGLAAGVVLQKLVRTVGSGDATAGLVPSTLYPSAFCDDVAGEVDGVLDEFHKDEVSVAAGADDHSEAAGDDGAEPPNSDRAVVNDDSGDLIPSADGEDQRLADDELAASEGPVDQLELGAASGVREKEGADSRDSAAGEPQRELLAEGVGAATANTGPRSGAAAGELKEEGGVVVSKRAASFVKAARGALSLRVEVGFGEETRSEPEVDGAE